MSAELSITASAPSDSHAVRRDDLTGADDDHVSWHDLFDLDLFHERTATPVRDSRCAFDEETQFASGTGVGGRLKGVAAGEHEGDDHGGEVFAEDERSGDREERDRIDAHIAMCEAARDRPDERPENDDGRAGPDERLPACRHRGYGAPSR